MLQMTSYWFSQSVLVEMQRQTEMPPAAARNVAYDRRKLTSAGLQRFLYTMSYASVKYDSRLITWLKH